MSPNTNHPLLSIEVVADEPLPDDRLEERIHAAVVASLAFRGYDRGDFCVRITNDSTIREINARHLDHDDATDVISFGYLANPPRVEGEIVVSIETAAKTASEIGWTLERELLLYVVHGTLHITEMDDQTIEERNQMRQAESQVMKRLGITDLTPFGPDVARPLHHAPLMQDGLRKAGFPATEPLDASTESST